MGQFGELFKAGKKIPGNYQIKARIFTPILLFYIRIHQFKIPIIIVVT